LVDLYTTFHAFHSKLYVLGQSRSAWKWSGVAQCIKKLSKQWQHLV